MHPPSIPPDLSPPSSPSMATPSCTLERQLVPLDLPGRNPMLPTLYYAHDHPLLPSPNRCIVFYQDLSPEAMKAVHDWEKEQSVPTATEVHELDALGLYHIEDNVLIFSREKGSTTAMDDVLSPSGRHEGYEGPTNEITPGPASVDDDGNWSGGLACERGDHRFHPVKKGLRCYTIANSFQSHKGIWSPVAHAKVNGSFGEHNLLQRNVTLALCPFAVAAMNRTPDCVKHIIGDYAGMLNIPPLGKTESVVHNTVQVNLCPALPFGSQPTMEKAIGPFAKSHNDKKDSPARFTTMTNCSNLPDSYTPSRFHIIRLGVYFTLGQFESASFCGLNYHGGTPSIAPLGVEYPPERMGDGLGHVVVGAMPSAKDKVLKMTAEMQTVDCESRINCAHSTQANFVADGVVVMDVQAHVNVMARMFLLLLIFLLNQLPLFYGIQVDSDRMLSSISFKVDGVQEHVGIWENRPGFRPAEPRMPRDQEAAEEGSSAIPPETVPVPELVPQELKRSTIMRRWRLHYNQFSRHIPYAVVNEKQYPIDETSALLVEAPLINDAVDHLGNPIEQGGRPYRKPAAPETPAKAARKAAAALKRKQSADEAESSETEGPEAKRKRKGKAKAAYSDVEPSTKDDEPPVRRNKKRKAPKSAPTTEASSVSEGPTPAIRRKKRQEIEANGSKELCISTGYLAAEKDWQASQMDVDTTVLSDKEATRTRADLDLDDFFLGSVEKWSDTYPEIKLLPRLQGAALTKDHAAVHQAYNEIVELDNLPIPEGPNSPLAAMLANMAADPGSIETSIHIARVWPQFEHLQSEAAMALLELKLHRQSTMITTACLWGWLDGYCVESIQAVLQKSEPATTWITKFTTHVHMFESTRASTRELTASQFGLHGLDGIYRYPKRKSLDVNVSECAVTELVIKIIAAWLHFPLKAQSHTGGWFVGLLKKHGLPELLFLDSVWWAFIHLDSEIFSHCNRKIDSPADFDRLANALRLAPISAVKSRECVLLQDMAEMLLDYRSGFASRRERPQQLLTMSEDLSHLRQLNCFLNYLLELEPLIDGSEQNSTPSLLQSTVSADRDYLLPFREHGPSRIRSRAPGGSFDPALSATRAGLFSGLIFRGVIFATEFSRKADAQTFFSSSAEWTAECAKYPDASGEFYCNLRAYGGSKSNRGVHLVQEYWTALATDDVPNWEKNTENKTYNFMECYKFLKHDNPNRFAEIGALIGFLLAADFAYTGIVTFPDEPTVATIMHEINAGGVKGLEIMGLINPRASGNGRKKKVPLAEVKSGFGSLYNFLDCKLSAESKRRMVFDAFMVEYSLCKSTRAVQRKLLRIPPVST
ncbi:hypothetical protein C8J57DRAFT_1230586 [Mycena rebaudengoi]|nr:hypothetical protein C8J57DRAFT_1230586 [Mycena rebaudengoi]